MNSQIQLIMLTISLQLIDTISSHSILPHILLLTIISKTSPLVNNIFSNSTSSPATYFFHSFFLKINSTKIQYVKIWLEAINLYLILILLIGSKFYSARKVILIFQRINSYLKLITCYKHFETTKNFTQIMNSTKLVQKI